MENEVWKVLEENSRYEVSSLGAVKSYGRTDYMWKVPRIIRPRRLPTNYLRVQIDGRDKYIHRLVAKAFIPNPKNLPLVNHLDADRTNNKITNLEWCNQKHNLAHAVKLGTMRNQLGEGNYASKLKSVDVLEMRQLYSTGRATVTELARKYDVSHSLVSGIVKHRRWTHI